MPLTRDDHKRINLMVAHELARVLSDHQGAKLMARHKARVSAPAEEAPDDEAGDMDAEVMAEMMAESPDDEEAEPPEEEDPEALDAVKRRRFGKRR
ncbi:MAG: hypothetical protein JXA90_09010 [Planctomycetes bacterium]|nr:hypothetical protein [Planctomycetota bacterium]